MPRTKVAEIDDTFLEADEEIASVLNDVKASLPGAQMKVEEPSNLGAFRMINIYHTITGVPQEVPAYMLTGEDGAYSLLRATYNDPKSVEAMKVNPKDWMGKRVWSLKPVTPAHPAGIFICRYSVEQPEEVKNVLKAKGLYTFCTNTTKFRTEADEDLHARKRHPNWHAFENNKRISNAADDNGVTTKALLAILEKITKEE